jgi:hypothetical protein
LSRGESGNPQQQPEAERIRYLRKQPLQSDRKRIEIEPFWEGFRKGWWQEVRLLDCSPFRNQSVPARTSIG